jgi:hypothetical protein
MILEESPGKAKKTHEPERRSYTGAFVAVFMLLAFLLVSNIYTLGKLDASRQSLARLQNDLYKRITTIQRMDEQLASRFSLVEDRHAEQIEALRRELDGAARELGSSTGHVLNRARTMLVHLQTDQQKQVYDLKQELAQKADSEDVGLLSRDVSAAKADVGTAQRTVGVLARDLATARTELGDLVATDRSDLEGLRRSSDRDYYEFALLKNQRQTVGGIGLVLKRTDLRLHRFSLNLIVNDQEIRNENQNLGQPIVFYVGDLKAPCQVVIVEVGSNTVKGYISAPKALAQADASNTGA